MTASKLPASYRVQRACANCRHVEGSVESLHCGRLGPAAPQRADFEDGPHRYKGDAFLSAWMRWADNRSVEPHGTCDEHEART